MKKPVIINIVEVKSSDMNAQLVAENIATQLEKRVSFRRALKQAMGRSMKAGAKGIKTQVSGRLGGAEIARTEHYHEGTIPLANYSSGYRLWLCRSSHYLWRNHRSKSLDLQR